MSPLLTNPRPNPHLTYGLSDTPGFFCICGHSDSGDVITIILNRDAALALRASLMQFIHIEEERERDDI